MEDIKAAVLMVATQVCEVGLNTLIKAATDKGMSDYVFVVYSNAMFLTPPSFFLPLLQKPTFSLYPHLNHLQNISSQLAQTLIYVGIGYSSPVLASVMSDLSLVFTFLLAIVFRYEKLDVTQVSSHAKCIGTVLSITRPLMVTLYRDEANSNGDSKVEDDKAIRAMGGSFVSQDEWLLGGIQIALGTFCI